MTGEGGSSLLQKRKEGLVHSKRERRGTRAIHITRQKRKRKIVTLHIQETEILSFTKRASYLEEKEGGRKGLPNSMCVLVKDVSCEDIWRGGRRETCKEGGGRSRVFHARRGGAIIQKLYLL